MMYWQDHLTTTMKVKMYSTVRLRLIVDFFLIDKEGVVRHQVVNDMPLGRSVDEAIRVIDALQFTEEYGEVCPANWKKGDKALKQPRRDF